MLQTTPVPDPVVISIILAVEASYWGNELRPPVIVELAKDIRERLRKDGILK